MRIVNAMLGRGSGGIEQALVDYCEAARLHGHEVHAVIHPKAQVRGALEALNVPLHFLPNLGAWDPIAIYRLRRMLEALQPDACIAHGNRAASLLIAAARGQKIIVAMHNYKIKCAAAPFVFYPTEDLLRHVRRQNPSAQCYYIPNLVRAPEEFRPRQWHQPPVIGAMGRFVIKKGFDVFIEALAQLKEKRLAFRAVLAGDGEEAAALKNLADEHGLEDVLRFSGWVTHQREFFDAIDLFCLPSSHEPFGIVLLEAMAQGLPVVAARSEGPSEILRDTVDGMLTPVNDAKALADALASLLATRLHAEQLGRNAYESVKQRYDLPVVAAKLDLALRSVARL